MNRFTDITKLDWEILNALSDDYESFEQIQGIIDSCGPRPCYEKEKILDRLERLHSANYVFLINNQTFQRKELNKEIEGKTKNRSFWFGRTESGYLAWEELTSKYLENQKTETASGGNG